MEKSRSKPLRKAIYLKQRADIIKTIEGGESYAKISKVYHVSKAQVANIKKNKKNINSLLENGASEEIKKIRKPEYPIVEKEGMKFVRWLRSQRMPVSMAIIQGRARMVGQGSQVPDFKASVGCMHRFLKRNNV